jgi:uncharacterized membrane protein YoaK (UPF0700 family)
MSNFAPAVRAAVLGKDDRDGPLPRLLLVLTMVTGIVDAVSFLKLGRVFVANMTGNVVFLGFGVADAKDFSIPTSLVAIAAFLVGALAGGRLALRLGPHRGRYLAVATSIETVLVGVALVVSISPLDPSGEIFVYAVIVLLAVAMGIQNAAARHLAVPNLTTTVLTLTLAGLAADSSFAGGKQSQTCRKLASVGAMLVGAALGAALVFRSGVGAALALALALLVLTGIAAYQQSTASANWAKGAQ